MAENRDYKVLILTSDPARVEHVTDVGTRNFENSTVVFWAVGDMSTKADVLRQIRATDYNLIISHINGIILKQHDLDKAHFGAVNIHPAPPEHGGAWGIWCQPVIRRDVRTHHGVTVHEMDADIDHGPIYRVDRWEVPENATIQSVVERSFDECFAAFEQVAEELGRSSSGTQCFAPAEETWDSINRHHTVEDVRRWFKSLDPGHPAHHERVPLNLPRAIFSPPYFDDL